MDAGLGGGYLKDLLCFGFCQGGLEFIFFCFFFLFWGFEKSLFVAYFLFVLLSLKYPARTLTFLEFLIFWGILFCWTLEIFWIPPLFIYLFYIYLYLIILV